MKGIIVLLCPKWDRKQASRQAGKQGRQADKQTGGEAERQAALYRTLQFIISELVHIAS